MKSVANETQISRTACHFAMGDHSAERTNSNSTTPARCPSTQQGEERRCGSQDSSNENSSCDRDIPVVMGGGADCQPPANATRR